MSESKADAPLVIEVDELTNPADAPAVAEVEAPSGQAMRTMAALAGRKRSRLGGWFWKSLVALIGFILSVTVWDFTVSLAARNPVLGWVAIVIIGVFIMVCVALLLREWAALARLSRIDALRRKAAVVVDEKDLNGARVLVGKLDRFYAGRDDMAWARERLAQRREDAFDVDALLHAADDTLLVPLDDLAAKEVEAAARQVATATALVPLAFADVAVALVANLRMIRRICEIYGGRSGVVGSWRLTRAVITHLVATGAVVVGDDLIGSLGGGQLLGKISRRFGEGLINGALTARVGIAAMEVSRPLAFDAGRRPRVSRMVRRALTGLFDKSPD